MAKRKRQEPALGEEGKWRFPDDCILHYHRRPFAAREAGDLFLALQREVRWEQKEVVVFNKRQKEPRLQCYQGDHEGLKYVYSGLTVVPEPWSPSVLAVRAKLLELWPDVTFNTCLLNHYRNGDDCMGWHSDQDLRRYGDAPNIASVSFGAERDFVLKRKDESGRQLVYKLGGGAALLMGGKTQEFWQHRVPKRAGAFARINLTFRNVLVGGAGGAAGGAAAGAAAGPSSAKD